MKHGGKVPKESFFQRIRHDEKLLTYIILMIVGIGGTILFSKFPISNTTVRTLLVLLASVVAIESGMNFSKRWMELNGTTNQK